jgi:GntR family transcriptional regulator, transcriptional repressor for pyruvate dehydrogenase complex
LPHSNARRIASRANPAPHEHLAETILRPVRGHHAFEACVERLGSAIRLGVYPVGSLLPAERDLAERLAVSRATLREAIAALREAGLVETRRGRGGGTVVTLTPPQSPSARKATRTTAEQRADWADALVFRRAVEGGAAEAAASRSLSSHERALLKSAHDAVLATATRAAHRQADSRFHLTLATISGSARLAEAAACAQSSLHEMLSAIPVLDPNIAHSDSQHTRITDAVLAGRPDLARRAMWQHCDDTAALLRGLLT